MPTSKSTCIEVLFKISKQKKLPFSTQISIPPLMKDKRIRKSCESLRHANIKLPEGAQVLSRVKRKTGKGIKTIR